MEEEHLFVFLKIKNLFSKRKMKQMCKNNSYLACEYKHSIYNFFFVQRVNESLQLRAIMYKPKMISGSLDKSGRLWSTS